jgi:hypothetical protein
MGKHSEAIKILLFSQIFKNIGFVQLAEIKLIQLKLKRELKLKLKLELKLNCSWILRWSNCATIYGLFENVRFHCGKRLNSSPEISIKQINKCSIIT